MSAMEHQSAKELFSDYLDGELSPEQTREVKAHLDECATCRAELEALERTLQSLSGLRPLPPPPDFGRKVQQRIRRRSSGRFFNPETVLTRIPWEWISFVIIMLMLVMYYLVVQQEQKVTVKRDPGVTAPASQPASRPASTDATTSRP